MKYEEAARLASQMPRLLMQQTAAFPPSPRGGDFWHLHLPVAHDFIDATATPFGVRRLCVQILIDRASYLFSIAPIDLETRVVVAVSLSELSNSQIIVFFGADYYDSFFKRDSENQRWALLKDSRSLAREWNLRVPDGFSQRGYREKIRDDDFSLDGEIW